MNVWEVFWLRSIKVVFIWLKLSQLVMMAGQGWWVVRKLHSLSDMRWLWWYSCETISSDQGDQCWPWYSAPVSGVMLTTDINCQSWLTMISMTNRQTCHLVIPDPHNRIYMNEKLWFTTRSSGFHVLSKYRHLPSNLCLEECVFIRWRILLTPSSVSQEKKWRQKTISNLISHYKVGPAGWAIPTAYLKHQSNMQQPFCLKHILELK